MRRFTETQRGATVNQLHSSRSNARVLVYHQREQSTATQVGREQQLEVAFLAERREPSGVDSLACPT